MERVRFPFRNWKLARRPARPLQWLPADAEVVMRGRSFGRYADHAVGMFGLLLVLLLGKLVPYTDTDTPGHSYPYRVRGWLARWAVEGIAAIGWRTSRPYSARVSG